MAVVVMAPNALQFLGIGIHRRNEPGSETPLPRLPTGDWAKIPGIARGGLGFGCGDWRPRPAMTQLKSVIRDEALRQAGEHRCCHGDAQQGNTTKMAAVGNPRWIGEKFNIKPRRNLHQSEVAIHDTVPIHRRVRPRNITDRNGVRESTDVQLTE
ncbi:hypothetical protein COCON_G00000650 [Conger conger]|uniref:Uncharacterized protein n=1 Tax=Conger conger TaxID=82655 RepID=A0A9Q1E0M8_CONCO|nr:hypothetical protein COCON_G00000650 [Conger conger]